MICRKYIQKGIPRPNVFCDLRKEDIWFEPPKPEQAQPLQSRPTAAVLVRNEMLSLIQRLLSTPTDHAEGSAAARPLCPRVLVITQDLRFYAAVLSAVSSTVWEVCLARSLAAALALCGTGTIPIVLYDQCVAQADWHEAFDRLRLVLNHQRVVLATAVADEKIWRSVLNCHGYDVVARNAGSAELKRVLRFAWISLQEGERNPIGDS
jgi:hypothetical protein